MIYQTAGNPTTWDLERDFVVLGSGAAGLTGALTAALEGASVVVLEKTELLGGTTALSGGGFWIPVNHHMDEVGVEDSREDALTYVRALSPGSADDDLLVSLVDNGREMIRDLEERGGLSFRAWPKQGGTWDYRSWLPGAKHGGRTMDAGKVALSDAGELAPLVRLGQQSEWLMDKHEYYAQSMHTVPPSKNGSGRQYMRDNIDAPPEFLASGGALVVALLKGCIDQSVEFRLSTPATSLIVDEGTVVGVWAEHEGQRLAVRARFGVLVATGGYSHNDDLKRRWMSRPLELSCEIEANQGDGHLMGIAVGAQVANLGDAWWMPHIPLAPDDELGPLNIGGTREDRSLPHTIIINKRGQRFVNESLNYYDIGEAFGTKQDGPKNLPAWLVFDEEGRERYLMLDSKITPSARYTQADSLAELAEKLGVDVAGFSKAVERFNGFCRDGVDEDFHRGESEWDREWGDASNVPNPALGSIAKPPFYAVELRSGALSTKGGLRVGPEGQVLSAASHDDQAIPGLYASGNASSGAIPQAYAGAGATIGPAMTIGWLAARHAVLNGRGGKASASLDTAASA